MREWLAHAEARGWLGDQQGQGDRDAIEAAVEELEVAEHELRLQNDELAESSIQLESERSRYMELFEAAPDPYFVTDSLGMIRQANRAAHELTGVAPTRLEGKPLAVLVAEADRSEFRAHLSRLGRLERLTNWDSAIDSRAGGPVPVSMSAVPAPLEYGGAIEIRWLVRDLRAQYAADETRRRLRHEQAARLASERAAEQAGFLARTGRAFLEVHVVADTARLTVRQAVPRLADLAILLMHEDAGRLRIAAARSLSPDDASAMDSLVDRYLDPDVFDGPVRVARTGESDIVPHVERGFVAACIGSPEPWMERFGTSMAVSLRERGRVRSVLWLLNERQRTLDPDLVLLTEAFADRAMAALHTATIHDELARARDDAARANEEKARAIATLSHDFRTPLAAVIGYADLLLEGLVEDVPQRALDWIARIRASTEHQLSLVDQALTYTRLEHGRELVRRESVEIGALVRTCADLFRRQAEGAGLELRALCPDHDVLWETDPGKLRQILTNLLGNAIRFTQRGHVSVSVALEHGDLVLTVSDTGVGIPVDAQSRIFDRFWQAEPKTEGSSNVGLGLTITRELTNLLGGSIDVESQPGQGTTFRLRIPPGST